MRKSTIGIIATVTALVVAGGIGTFVYYSKVMKPANAYKAAESLLEEKKYDEAKAKFIDMGDYKDAKDKAIECDYQKASGVLAEGKIDEAKAIFSEIGAYKNSVDMVKECDYQKALDYYNAGDYENSVKILCNIFDYSDSKTYVYNTFRTIAGQNYIDESAKTIECLNNYIQSQAESFMDWAYKSYYGLTTETWTASFDDQNYKDMRASVVNLNAISGTLNHVFCEEVLTACNDDKLTAAYNQFGTVHSCSTDIFSKDKAREYVMDMCTSSTAALESDMSKYIGLMTTYTDMLENMK